MAAATMSVVHFSVSQTLFPPPLHTITMETPSKRRRRNDGTAVCSPLTPPNPLNTMPSPQFREYVTSPANISAEVLSLVQRPAVLAVLLPSANCTSDINRCDIHH